ncbi:MAG: histidine phosphatase family protein [Cereibacter sphaeroides]|uniref:Histidine phosphatase family protein n=1 Tax=Cereibacter sphaeroides TaxID=1063 RepID=A0A2W5SEZ9_CERSP|nr:MAG: histidine phosphatase family protein [Cereibacter sphaeroides]
MTRFWWVRHGPTHQKSFTGWRDVPADLSDHAAIARLDAFLPAGALLISSDLSRAVATADAIGKGRKRLAHDADLREFHFGDWDGKGFDEVAASHPELSRIYWEQPGDAAPPGGESWNAAAARIASAVARLSLDHPGRDIIVVAHMGSILTQVQAARGIAAAEALSQPIDPLSVTRIDFEPRPILVQVNHRP